MTDAAIVVVTALIGGLLVLGGLLYARRAPPRVGPGVGAIEPPRGRRGRPRASATWAEFVDWLRLGR